MLVAALATTAWVVVGAAPSDAAVIPTYTSAWSYQSTSAFSYSATVPGAALTGTGTDNAGQRTTTGSLADRRVDGYCAAAFGGSDLTPAFPTIHVEVCDGERPVGFTDTFTAGLRFKLCLVSGPPITPSSDVLGCVAAPWVQSSVDDPTLRTPGAGASWTYAPSSAWYTFALRRPGVHVEGDSYHPTATTRSVVGTLANTGAIPTCASVEAIDDSGPASVTASACTGQPVPFSKNDFDNFSNSHLVDISACSKALLGPKRCVTMPWALGQPQGLGFNAP